MVEKLEGLTSEQKKDLQDFVNIAHKKENLDLWWRDGYLYCMSIEDYFEYELDELNKIFIHFPVKETGEILQFISGEDIDVENGLDPFFGNQEYCFRFKKIVKSEKEIKIINPSGFETKQLLEGLQKLLTDLRTNDFETHF